MAIPDLSIRALPREDAIRSADRFRVHRARHDHRGWYLCWLLVGPGVLAMLGENDGPSMLSYTATGAMFGLRFFLPFVVLTFAMAVVCQEMCMRVASVTQRGFAALVTQRYGRVWGWFSAGDLVLTNLVTLVAEFVAIRVGLAYFHIGAGVAAGLGVLLVLVMQGLGRYRRWERVVLGLAVFNGLFLVAAILVGSRAGSAVHSAASPALAGGGSVLLLVLASTVGATVTPWMIFFQQGATADKGMVTSDIRHGRIDTVVGGALAAVFGCAALVVGAALVAHGAHGPAAQAMANAQFAGEVSAVAGHAAGAVFALALVEAGAIAVLTISASTAYAATECLGVPHSFNNAPRAATVFHWVNLGVAVLAAAVILLPGAPLLRIALNANVLSTVLLPVALVFLLMLANDRELMGPWVNRRAHNAAGVAIVVLIGLCGAAYAVYSFLTVAHVVPGS